MRHFLLFLLALAAASGCKAHAQLPPPPGVFYATVSNASAGSSQCLIFGGNGADTNPSRYNWGSGPFCGLPGGLSALMGSHQAVWKFVPLADDRYMITNASGSGGERCLIFGQNGNALYPQRYNWGPGPFCGVPGGKAALIGYAQAVWRVVPLGGTQYMITNSSGSGGERCLIFGSGTAAHPQRYNWGAGPYCGFPGGKEALLANRQAVWTIEPLNFTWQLGSLTNQTTNPITVNVPFPSGTADVAAAVSARGDAALGIVSFGLLIIQDRGYASSCLAAYRRALITMGSRTWSYFYQPDARLSITVGADGTPTFSPSSSSDHVVAGDMDFCQN